MLPAGCVRQFEFVCVGNMYQEKFLDSIFSWMTCAGKEEIVVLQCVDFTQGAEDTFSPRLAVSSKSSKEWETQVHHVFAAGQGVPTRRIPSGLCTTRWNCFHWETGSPTQPGPV